MLLNIFTFFRDFNEVVDEVQLIHDLSQNLRKQVIDVDILENSLKEQDKTGDDQITFDQVESVLSTFHIQLDRMVMIRWMKAARTAGLSSCSIASLVAIISKAVNPIHKMISSGSKFC